MAAPASPAWSAQRQSNSNATTSAAASTAPAASIDETLLSVRTGLTRFDFPQVPPDRQPGTTVPEQRTQ